MMVPATLPMEKIEFIDAYCERLEPGLWAEPFNVLTNLAFLMAGFLLLRLLVRNQGIKVQPTWDLWLLALCVFLIGIGSTLWHLYATPWAELADLLPITLLINVFLLSFLLRIERIQVWQVVGLFLTFHIFSLGVIKAFPEDFFNGSIFYVSTWTALWVIVIYLSKFHHPLAKSFLSATLIFSVSIILRSLDLEVCEYFSTGTHFIWHLLNAVVLYLLVGGLISQRRNAEIQPDTGL